MPKVIEFDLTGEDAEVWEQRGGLAEPPSPGIYQFKIHEINPGFSKGDNGKPDKSRPRLEVIYEVIGDSTGDAEGEDIEKHVGARVWDYVSFSKASTWKQAEFFRALGEGSPAKAKGKFNAEKHEGNTIVKGRVRADSYEGQYQPKMAAVWPWEDNGEGGVDEDLMEEISREDLPTPDEVRGMKVAELKELAEEHGVDLKGLKKAGAIDKIIEELELEAAAQDEEEMDDWDEELEEDEEPDYTAEQVREMSPAELKELAKEAGVSLKGMKKSEAIEALIEELGLEDDDEVPF